MSKISILSIISELKFEAFDAVAKYEDRKQKKTNQNIAKKY